MTCEVAQQLLGLISSPIDWCAPSQTPQPSTQKLQIAFRPLKPSQEVLGSPKEALSGRAFSARHPLIKSLGKEQENQPLVGSDCGEVLRPGANPGQQGEDQGPCIKAQLLMPTEWIWPFRQKSQRSQSWSLPSSISSPSSSFSSSFPGQHWPGFHASRAAKSGQKKKKAFCIQITASLPYLQSSASRQPASDSNIHEQYDFGQGPRPSKPQFPCQTACMAFWHHHSLSSDLGEVTSLCTLVLTHQMRMIIASLQRRELEPQGGCPWVWNHSERGWSHEADTATAGGFSLWPNQQLVSFFSVLVFTLLLLHSSDFSPYLYIINSRKIHIGNTRKCPLLLKKLH